jgi:multiple sugar transport system permease protein
MNNRLITKLTDSILYLVLGLGAFIIMIPFLWLLSTAFKDKPQIFMFPPKWLPDPFVWSNFVTAFTYADLPFYLFFVNSTTITMLATIGTIFSSSMVAFAFARLRWSGRDTLFFIVIMTMMIPKEVIIVPEFIIFRSIGWVDSFLPLIVPSFFGSAFYIFIIRQYMLTISPEMDQAARIDGCSTWKVYWRIILPQSYMALWTVAIFSIQNHWNDFMGPLIYLDSTRKYTLSLGLSMFSGQYGTEWGLLMAASFFVMLPILCLFILAQKYFIQGIVVTGIK